LRRGPTDLVGDEPAFRWADPDFFKVFPLPALAGNPAAALQQPDTAVITRRLARKYFGQDLPIGATLLAQGADLKDHPLRVAAVLKDLPSNTNLSAEIFASGRSSYSYLNAIDANPLPGGADYPAVSTYVRLAPGASAASLKPALDRAGKPHADAVIRLGGNKVSYQLAALDDAHWAPAMGPVNPGSRTAGNKTVTYAIATVGGLIVLVASINFVTLMTARAGRRGVEVGVRKATGARRGDLVAQFMGEALVQVAASALIAAALAEILIKPFDALVQRDLSIDFVHDPLLLGALVSSALVVGVLASIYPAVVLSSFRPAAVLKGGVIRASGSPMARTGLVAIQFGVLVGLIVTTTTIYRQTQFALKQGLGAQDSQLMAAVFTRCKGAFADEVRKLPGVSGAACSTIYPLNLSLLMTSVYPKRGERLNFDVAPVGVGFFELYGVRPVAGRLFSNDHGEDLVLNNPDSRVQPTVVINETAARRLGFSRPRDAVGKTMTWDRHIAPGDLEVPGGRSEIIGVAPDMPVTVRSAVDPTFYFVAPKFFDFLSIRMTGHDMPGTARAIQAAWKRTGHPDPMSEFSFSQFRISLYLDLAIQAETMAICAGIAIVLAGVGLFALAAYMTERRTKEIGIRKSMGASKWDVVLMLLWQFTIPVLCAVAVAAPAGFFAMHDWLNQFAYRVPLSFWTFAVSAVGAMEIAWLTVGWQSWIAARARPAGALQYE
jgi:putative ABC transport system permease protein